MKVFTKTLCRTLKPTCLSVVTESRTRKEVHHDS